MVQYTVGRWVRMELSTVGLEVVHYLLSVLQEMVKMLTMTVKSATLAQSVTDVAALLGHVLKY